MITVWCADLDAAGDESVLSGAEHARAARLRGDTHRSRWIASHVALRRVLAAALDTMPASLEFTIDEQGKPHLAGEFAGVLEFSLSHSAALALVAVSRAAPVGVDLELIEPVTDIEAVARRHFAPEEARVLERLEGNERVEAFYRIWTRKEAYLKATGAGLGHKLDAFAVSHGRDDARVTQVDGDEATAAIWTLADLRLDGPYVGAVATPIRGATVRVDDSMLRVRTRDP